MSVWVAIVILMIISAFLFCCVRVGAKADREMEKIFKKRDNDI